MKILLATDGSSQATNALRYSAQIVRRSTEPPTVLAIFDEHTKRSSARIEKTLHQSGELLGVPDLRYLARFGKAFEAIMTEVSQASYDLVIMGDRRPKNLLTRYYWGSTAIRVAENAPCSVLIVRGKASPIARILLCDSGSGKSLVLSRVVVRLAQLLDGEEDITILHVMSQMTAGPGVRGGQLRSEAEALIEERTPEGYLLEYDLHMLATPGVHPIPKVRHGLVVDEILAEASSGDYHLVVVGAHPFEGAQRLILDNIARQIMKYIARPILIVRANDITDNTGAPPKPAPQE